MMEDRKFIFYFDDLGLTVEGIEGVIGYNEGDDREFIASMIADVLGDCSRIADVRAEYRIFSNPVFDKNDKVVSIENTSFNVDKIVFAQIRKSEHAALFLCTAGPEVGRKSRKYMQERDLLTGYIYDIIGSEIVEAAANLMQNALARSAGLNSLKITNRYSPGYCGWKVDEQHKLFGFFRNNHCGIKLLPSALMDPEKSVSGIIGIGQTVKLHPYICRMCEMKDCIYRKHKVGMLS